MKDGSSHMRGAALWAFVIRTFCVRIINTCLVDTLGGELGIKIRVPLRAFDEHKTPTVFSIGVSCGILTKDYRHGIIY